MKTKVKALQTFVHGRERAEIDGEYQFTKGDAEDLAKAGLVEIVEEKAIETPRLQDVKMEDAPENKMAEAPSNKSRQKKGE